jgi:hypothetical protein
MMLAPCALRFAAMSWARNRISTLRDAFQRCNWCSGPCRLLCWHLVAELPLKFAVSSCRSAKGNKSAQG